jgi:hypothetical protein
VTPFPYFGAPFLKCHSHILLNSASTLHSISWLDQSEYVPHYTRSHMMQSNLDTPLYSENCFLGPHSCLRLSTTYRVTPSSYPRLLLRSQSLSTLYWENSYLREYVERRGDGRAARYTPPGFPNSFSSPVQLQLPQGGAYPKSAYRHIP